MSDSETTVSGVLLHSYEVGQKSDSLGSKNFVDIIRPWNHDGSRTIRILTILSSGRDYSFTLIQIVCSRIS